MLDRLAGPDEIEARVRQWQLSFGLDQTDVKLWVALASAAHGLASSRRSRSPGLRPRSLGRELPFAAADVQHARGAPDPLEHAPNTLEQESFAQGRVRRRARLGGLFPDGVVVVARWRHGPHKATSPTLSQVAGMFRIERAKGRRS